MAAAFWHLFIGLTISTISLIASLIFLTTTNAPGFRYFCVAWTTVSAAMVWILVCACAVFWMRSHEGAMVQEPRRRQIGRTIFSVCWPNGSQGSFHSYHRNARNYSSTAAPRTNDAPPPTPPKHDPGLVSSLPTYEQTTSAPARIAKPSQPASLIPFPPTIYSQARYTHTPSASLDSRETSNSRTALIHPDPSTHHHHHHHQQTITRCCCCCCCSPRPTPHSTSNPSLIYPDSKGFFHTPNLPPHQKKTGPSISPFSQTSGPRHSPVSPVSQTSVNRYSAVSALSLDTHLSQAKFETASVMRTTRPQTQSTCIEITPPTSRQSRSSGGGSKGGRVQVNEDGSPRKVAVCGAQSQAMRTS